MKGRRVVVANGPNLNTLGTREPEIYGLQTLADIQAMVDAKAHDLGWTADFFQSNHEGELVDRLQRTPADAVGVIINPAGLTHYSIALYDCLRALPVPIVERKESYRQTSVTAPAAAAVITGMGSRGYVFAMEYLSGLYE